MKLFKKIVLAIVLFTTIFVSACSTKPTSKTSTKKMKVVAAIYPAYDWIKEIMGDNFKNAEVTYLLDKGVDLHSYQASVEDIAKIKEADLFLHVGGESDKWVADALKDPKNKNRKVINMVETIGKKALEEEIVEGMQKDHDHHHEHEHKEDHKHEEEKPELDEHVWLSLENAKKLVQSISDQLIALDSNHKELYSKNTKEYLAKLDKLQGQYKEVISQAQNKTLVFGDRFPFRYLTHEFGLKYFAAFSGCSAESEASFETIAFLAKKVDALGLKNILAIDGSNQKIAKTIISNTKTKDQGILTLDSLQTSTTKDKTSYLEAMQKNLETLKKYFSN
ncbi:metal ABC transporter substrate-binding protein [Bulleidia sp. zg-1006]|uniref:metal ABC transporter substrate-binding protein n=1 Tax=Bulleidia sp. zg-1006 TaxID=2806552 RepID=UPI00193A4B6E|nr:metal ABC transporter substrate-binding protein [Bulleidia sp. zg-1006]QRG87042.1 zinc ABC transporter substrate-binding protein [Bulleidia sp. zg-1006]